MEMINDYELVNSQNNILIESLIDGFDELIMKQFMEYGKYGGTYTNAIINTKINSIIKQKLNKHTTTQIFNHLFEAKRSGKIVNGKYQNTYRILGIK